MFLIHWLNSQPHSIQQSLSAESWQCQHCFLSVILFTLAASTTLLLWNSVHSRSANFFMPLNMHGNVFRACTVVASETLFCLSQRSWDDVSRWLWANQLPWREAAACGSCLLGLISQSLHQQKSLKLLFTSSFILPSILTSLSSCAATFMPSSFPFCCVPLIKRRVREEKTETLLLRHHCCCC